MYINFWYPIASGEVVTNKEPHRAEVLGVKLVAFRDDAGNAHVLADTCIHRGGSLGKGWVKDNCVVCPYHGWRFDEDGKCVGIPTFADDEKPPARAKVDSYPVQEKYGIVFAFLGDLAEEERPPLREIPEWSQEGWRANKLVVFEIDAYYERSMENGLDPSHNEFVHPTQGSPTISQDLKREPLEVQDVPWGSEFIVNFENEVTGTEALGGHYKLEPEVLAGSGHIGPNQMITWINFSKDHRFSQYFFEAPINENRTRVFFVNMRSWLLEPENDNRITKVNMLIAQEDIDLLEELDPVRTPNSPSEEVLVRSDGAITRYRECLKEWTSRGWRIDMKSLSEQRGDRAFAIPSPARKTSKNWVQKPIPLVSAGKTSNNRVQKPIPLVSAV